MYGASTQNYKTVCIKRPMAPAFPNHWKLLYYIIRKHLKHFRIRYMNPSKVFCGKMFSENQLTWLNLLIVPEWLMDDFYNNVNFFYGSEIQVSKQKNLHHTWKKKKYDYTYIFKEVINKIIFQTCQHYLHSNPLAMTRNFFARFIAIQEYVRIKSSEYHMT